MESISGKYKATEQLILCRDPSCGTCVLKQSGILGLKRQVVEN
jgi:hypothetical protein